MKIGSVGGIGVYIHWTFWVLILFYLISTSLSLGIWAGLYAVTFIAGVFACVVAHEFGHAGAAAMYGIRTADITLLPIGGVARLTRLPEKPIQELVIALAGPAVNVVIAGVLFALVVFGLIIDVSAPALGLEMTLLEQLLFANVFLAAFNLLPAFPMDGGRVLRSLLALRLSYVKATQIAARVGRWMALFFVLMAIYTGHLMLLLIAGFIFLAGTAELMGVRMREVAKQGSQGRSPFATWQTQAWPSPGAYGDPPSAKAVDGGDLIIEADDFRRIR